MYGKNTPSILKKFGNTVRNKRESLNFSQERLASLAGVHRTYIGMIERGEKSVSLIKIENIAKALKTSVSDLTRDL